MLFEMFEVGDVGVVEIHWVVLNLLNWLDWCAVMLTFDLQHSAVVISFAEHSDFLIVAGTWNNRRIVLTPSPKRDAQTIKILLQLLLRIACHAFVLLRSTYHRVFMHGVAEDLSRGDAFRFELQLALGGG